MNKHNLDPRNLLVLHNEIYSTREMYCTMKRLYSFIKKFPMQNAWGNVIKSSCFNIRFLCIYSYLSASIGFIFAALLAG